MESSVPSNMHEIGAATAEDLDSLSTIFARSFHPVNPFQKNCHPDTPKVRGWWRNVFSSAIKDPACDVLVARLHRLDEVSTHVIGVISIRRYHEFEQGAGLWTEHDLTDDHDHDALLPVGQVMAVHREQLMSSEAHHLLDLLAVDQAFKGLGLGRNLLQAACRVADEARLAMFVQSNTMTKGLYCKHGFEEKCRVVLPGELEYVEHMLVRPPSTS